MRLQGATDDRATRFVADLPATAVEGGLDKTKYFWKGYYPRATMTNYADFGDDTIDHLPAEKRGEFFAVTLTAEEVQP